MTDVVLITASPRTVSTGAAATVRLAGGGHAKPYLYGGNQYRAGVATLPRFAAALEFDENGWTGGVVPTTGVITWAPSSKADLAAMAAYFWPKAAVTVETGPEDTAVFTTRLTGKVADAVVQDGRLVITIADLTAGLNSDVVTPRFAGTGGVEGGSEATGRIKRRTWGRAFNIEGRVLDKATNVYEFGALDYPWQEFTTVRDMGRDAAPTPTVIAWAGSIASTLTALKAATPVQGSGAVAPSIACVKWWTQPAGPLTADVKGEIGGGYVETAAAIAERILTAVSGPAITNTAAAVTLRNLPAGIHVDEGETIAAAINRLLLGVSLIPVFNAAGTVTIKEFTFSSPVESLPSDSVQRERTLPPVKTRRLGYQRGYRLHSDGEIAASLLQLDPDAGTILAELGDDGKLTIPEKRNLIKIDGDAEAEYQVLLARVTALGLTVPIENKHVRSQEFDNAAWSGSVNGVGGQSLVTANAATAPDGTVTADLVTLPSTTTNTTALVYTLNPIALSAVPNSEAIWLKGVAGGEQLWLSFTPDAVTYYRQAVTLTRNWQRFVLTFTPAAGSLYLFIGVDKRDAGQSAKPAMSFHVWGAQLNEGSAPYDYRASTSAAQALSTASASESMTAARAAWRAVRDAIVGWDNPETVSDVPDPAAFVATWAFFAEKRKFVQQMVGEQDSVAGIVGQADVQIPADYLGAPKAGELSKVLAYKLYRGGVQVTTGVTWSATTIGGNVTHSISGSGTATFTITGPNDATLTDESIVRITATHNGVATNLDLPVRKANDPPPVGGTGGSGNPGTTVNTSTFATISSTSYGSAIAGPITVKAGTNGQIRCTLPLSYRRTPGTAAGLTGMLGKVQWRVPGGSWADIAAETADSGDAETEVSPGDPAVNYPGSINIDVTKTGLTTGSDYEVQFLARKSDTSGDVDNIYVSGGAFTAAGT